MLQDKIIVMCCLIKCADLSNEIRPTEMAQRWAKMVITEFFAQSVIPPLPSSLIVVRTIVMLPSSRTRSVSWSSP